MLFGLEGGRVRGLEKLDVKQRPHSSLSRWNSLVKRAGRE